MADDHKVIDCLLKILEKPSPDWSWVRAPEGSDVQYYISNNSYTRPKARNQRANKSRGQ